jgi:hypothetical protein
MKGAHVTIATIFRTLKLHVVGHERPSTLLISVGRVYSVSTENILMWICEVYYVKVVL